MSSIVIVGVQWGDEGKGKIVDALAGEANLVVRFQGGDNAGHTVYCEGKKFVLHILPSGVLRDGIMNIIGGGVVVNPRRLRDELQEIGLPDSEWSNRLRISGEAHLILPCHIALDKVAETRAGDDKIGTTLRGIGPAYADRAARIGIRMSDTLDENNLRERLQVCFEAKRTLLPDDVAREVLDVERAEREIMALLRPVHNLIVDTAALLWRARAEKKRILFEGAQGTMLDVSAGTYPFVTSSNTIAGGVCVGAGIGPNAIDKVLGVAKAYATRVGAGPFPSELSDDNGTRLREIGGEYGATTRRPRRCGWLDLVQLRRAVALNGLQGLILTKLDVLDAFEQIGVCTAYECHGRRLQDFPVNPVTLRAAQPVFEYWDGWNTPTTKAQTFNDLPFNMRRYIAAIEQYVQVPVVMLSNGPDRTQLIAREKVFL